MARVGLVAPIFQFWDRTSQALVATRFSKTTRGIRSSCNVNSSRLPSSSWTGCIPNVEVLFDHEVIDVAQSADAVTVQVRGPSGVISQHSGVYLIGADGGRSTLRGDPASHSKASPGRSASSSSPRRSISKPNAGIAIAATSPIPAHGAIASRSRPTARRDFGARSTPPTRRKASRTF